MDFARLDPIRIIAMHESRMRPSLIRPLKLKALGLIFRDTHPHQSADQASRHRADTRTSKRCRKRSGRDNRPHARNSEGGKPENYRANIAAIRNAAALARGEAA